MKTTHLILSLSCGFMLFASCGKKGLDNKDNQQEKDRHENFRDSTDQDSSTSSINFEMKFATTNKTYRKTYNRN